MDDDEQLEHELDLLFSQGPRKEEQLLPLHLHEKSSKRDETADVEGPREVSADLACTRGIAFQFPEWSIQIEKGGAFGESPKIWSARREISEQPGKRSKGVGGESGASNLDSSAKPCDSIRVLSLPVEVWYLILQHVEFEDICSLRQVCKKLWEVGSQEEVWAKCIDQSQARKLLRPADLASRTHLSSYLQFKGCFTSARKRSQFHSLAKGHDFLRDGLDALWDVAASRKMQPASRDCAPKDRGLRKSFGQEGKVLARAAGGVSAVRKRQEAEEEEEDVGAFMDESGSMDCNGGWGRDDWKPREEDKIVRSQDGWVLTGADVTGRYDVSTMEQEGTKGLASRVDGQVLKKVMLKLTRFDWSLLYASLWTAFSDRADRIGFEVASLVNEIHERGGYEGNKMRLNAGIAQEEIHSSKEGDRIRASRGNCFEKGRDNSVGKQPEKFLDSGRELLLLEEEASRQQQLLEGVSPTEYGRCLSTGKTTRVIDMQREWDLEWDVDNECQLAHGDWMQQRPGQSEARVASSRLAVQGRSSLETTSSFSPTDAEAIWRFVLLMWRRYKGWLKLVGECCTNLHLEVMVERARSAQAGATPTVYDMGVSLFRSSVLLSFGVRRTLQDALLVLKEERREGQLGGKHRSTQSGSDDSSGASCPDALEATAGASLSRRFDLAMSIWRMYQELDLADDSTLSSVYFTQEKLVRCFKSLSRPFT